MADTKFEIILRIFFLKFSNVNMLFGKRTFTWKIYTINKTLSATKQVHIIYKKDFVIMALDVNSKTFVIDIAI